MEIIQNMQSGSASSLGGVEYLCGVWRIYGFWLLTKSQTIQPFGNHFQAPRSLGRFDVWNSDLGIKEKAKAV
jgi:hypothetical protein